MVYSYNYVVHLRLENLRDLMTGYELTWIFVLILFPFILLAFFRRKEQKLFKKRLLAAELALKEHETATDKKKNLKKSGITVTLTHQDSDHYLLELLRNIEMELLLEENQAHPFVLAEYNKKFPVSRLISGKAVTITTVQYATSPSVYNIRVHWTDPDGARVADQIYVEVSS